MQFAVIYDGGKTEILSISKNRYVFITLWI